MEIIGQGVEFTKLLRVEKIQSRLTVPRYKEITLNLQKWVLVRIHSLHPHHPVWTLSSEMASLINTTKSALKGSGVLNGGNKLISFSALACYTRN